MHENYHISMTRKVLAGHFSEPALYAIVTANIGQDSILNLLKGRFHFDANDYAGAKAYVEEQEREILKQLDQGNAQNAWAAFGRLTHAWQDFYAHTNYVALWRERHPENGPASDHSVPAKDQDILSSDRLIAAKVYYPLEALTYFKALRPALRRLLPADSHANMNLDSPASGELFDFAISAAEDRTEITFREVKDQILSEIGPEALQLFLDKTPA